jgi:uncharacterized protein
MLVVALIIIGLAAGLLSGFVGVGGGVLIVPALVVVLGFSQKLAQGTTLALLVAPIGVLAAYSYYKAGQVDLKAAMFIIAGFLVGSYVSSLYATHVSDKVLTKVFAVFLAVVAVKLFTL